MTSQLNYMLARDHVAELARGAERRRRAQGLLALSEERELALAERGVKRAPVAGGGLKGQQRSLAVEPAAVPGQRSVRADDTVARDYDRDRGRAHGCADGARLRSEQPAEGAVRRGRAVRKAA